MAGPSKPLLAALEPHLGPVRAVLHDMETNDVPVPVRKVAAYTGKRLPPPLLKSLVVELDHNEWLRAKVCDEAASDLDEVALAFLERGDGWWTQVADVAAAAAAREPVEDLSPKIDLLEQQLAEAKRRNADLRASCDEAAVELKALRRQLRSESQLSDAAGRTGELAGELAALHTRLAAEQSRRRDSEERLDEMKRRRRPRLRTVENGSGEGRAAGMADPVAAARRLDLQAAAMAAAVRGQPIPEEDHAVDPSADADELALPAGIAPDSVEAIEWLVQDAGPLPVIVDGYNLTFLLEPERFTASVARQRMVSELERFLRYARAAHRVLLVFDSSVETEAPPELSEGGVEVFFATNAENADDEIVERVRGFGGRAVVLTNDRELRERADALGALSLWATPFVGWARRS